MTAWTPRIVGGLDYEEGAPPVTPNRVLVTSKFPANNRGIAVKPTAEDVVEHVTYAGLTDIMNATDAKHTPSWDWGTITRHTIDGVTMKGQFVKESFDGVLQKYYWVTE